MNDSLCPICKNPKQTERSGSLTQWIVTCECDLQQDESAQGLSISVCRTCGKRTRVAKPGSISQIIFQAEYCSCAAFVQPVAQPVPMETIENTEEELECDPKTFPVDRYKPLSILGSGGEGKVYLARDRLLDKMVAVKVLHRLDRKQVLSFQEQAKALSKLGHKYLSKILDFGVIENSVPYMVMEFVPGHSLQQIIEKDGSLDWYFAINVFAQICDGLSYAHSHKIYYRDLKPANVLIQYKDELHVRLIDPALPPGGESTENELVGTPLYMSPDEALKRPYDERSEVYSVACMLFETLTGRPPFNASTSLLILKMHAENPPPDFVLPEDFDSALESAFTSVLHKALAKDPAHRYRNMAEFKGALQDIQTQFGTPSEKLILGTTDTTYGSTPKGRNIFADTTLALLAIVIVVTGIALGPKLFSQKPSARPSEISAEFDELASKEKDKKIAEKEHERKLQDEMDIYEKEKWRPTDRDGETIYLAGPLNEDADFKLLKQFPNVRALRVVNSDSITGEGLAEIKDLNLTFIEIQSNKFSDEGVKQICGFKSLSHLTLGWSDLLTDRSISELSKLQNLQIVALTHLKLPSKTIDTLARCPRIVRLEVNYSTPFTRNDLLKLSSFPSLLNLSLCNLNLKDADCKIISKLPLLTGIDLLNNDITDEGVAYLAQKPLVVLDVSGNKSLTDAAIDKLQKVRTLTNVTIINCPNISEKAKAAFRKSHPNCKFTETDLERVTEN